MNEDKTDNNITDKQTKTNSDKNKQKDRCNEKLKFTLKKSTSLKNNLEIKRNDCFMMSSI